MPANQPQSVEEFVAAIRAELVCARCGRYVGSLGVSKYLPPPYPVALDRIGTDDEVSALIGFEWHMVGRIREGNFTLMHPERDGACVSVREWLRRDDDDEAGDDAAGDDDGVADARD